MNTTYELRIGIDGDLKGIYNTLSDATKAQSALPPYINMSYIVRK